MSSSNGHSAVLELPQQEVAHAFVPRDLDQPWGLCVCGFAESSHLGSAQVYAPTGLYRCPDCVMADKPACNHSRSGEQPLS